MFLIVISYLLSGSCYVYTFISTFLSIFHTVLPYGLDVGLLGVSAYYLTRLRKPDPDNVMKIFGPEPGSKEYEANPEKVVRCIAHRGAGLDAPENTMQAFKYVSANFLVFLLLVCERKKDLIFAHSVSLVQFRLFIN